MPTQTRHLVTTADERTWKFDRPVLFLGEWCRIYRRKEAWNTMDAIVAAPYGLTPQQRDSDEEHVLRLEAAIFPLICDVLNKHHGTMHGKRFWKILIGHWLRYTMCTVFNRYRTITQCLNTYVVAGTTTVTHSNYDLARPDSLSAIHASSESRWNQALYLKVISKVGMPGIAVETIHDIADEPTPAAPNVPRPFQQRLLGLARPLAIQAVRLLKRDSDAFIVNTYLPLAEEIKLQLALGQVPQRWGMTPCAISSRSNPALRHELGQQLGDDPVDPLGSFIRATIFELIPVCYLEGFPELREKASLVNWPKSPRFIFTGNSFHFDEVFKYWTASHTESGTPYFTAQHGGNYSVRRIPLRSVEEETGDKFLTWGWADGSPQHRRAFIIRTAGRSQPKYARSPKGGLLLVQECMSPRTTTWDDTEAFSRCWDDQLTFIRALHPDARSDVTVRLHKSFESFTWSELDRLHEFDPKLKVNTGWLPMDEAVARSRLLIFSYDSSGIQEALSQNIPVVAFWRSGLDYFRDSAKPFIRALMDAGLFHASPESAARQINEVSGDIQGWWQQGKIQATRKAFCDEYARTSLTPVADLKRVLLSE